MCAYAAARSGVAIPALPPRSIRSPIIWSASIGLPCYRSRNIDGLCVEPGVVSILRASSRNAGFGASPTVLTTLTTSSRKLRMNDALGEVARPSRIAAAASTADHCQIGVAILLVLRKDLEKVYARRKRRAAGHGAPAVYLLECRSGREMARIGPQRKRF